VLLQTKIPSTT